MAAGTNPNKNKKVANSLVALSSAAVLTVYAAGFMRTKAAAEKFEDESTSRRPRRVPAPVAVPTEPNEPAAASAAPLPVQQIAKLERPVTPLPASVAETPAPAPAIETTAPAPVPVTVATVPAPVTVAAPAPVAVPTPAPAPAAPVASMAADPPHAATAPWKDGVWKAWGSCRHGDIEATVTIESGRIASAVISDCRTRYSCDVIAKLPPQVAQRQSPDTDSISSATQSSDAFYFAVYDALEQAHKAARAAGLTAAPKSN